jgi:putative FmdB family regulatory protein
MPLYEYHCKNCDYIFEKLQSFKSTLMRECPKCSGELIVPITTSSLRFNGTGFYINDYGKKSQ